MTYAQMLELARKNLNPVRRGEFYSSGFVSAVLEGADGKRKRYLRRLFWGRAPVHPTSLESFMDRILVETLFRH